MEVVEVRSMLHVKCLACLSCRYGTTCMDLHSHEKKEGKHLAQRGRGCIYLVREKDVINWGTFNIHTIKT